MKIDMLVPFPGAIIFCCLLLSSCGVFDPVNPYVSFRHWAASYGGSRDEVLNSAACDNSGSLYAAGYTETFGAGNGDAWLIKTGDTGKIEWQKSYYYDTGTSETFKRIRLLSDGTLLALCNIISDKNGSFAIMNINSRGDVSWFHYYDGLKNETAEDCIHTPGRGDGYLITGSINSVTASLSDSGENDAFLLAVDIRGDFLWQNIYGGREYDEAIAVLPAPDGGAYLAGNTVSFGSGKSDYWLVKTDSKGTVDWQKAFGGKDDEFLCSAVATLNNTILLAGISASSGVMNLVKRKNFVYWLLCLNHRGDIIWQKTYHDPKDTGIFARDITCAVHESTIKNRYIFTLSATLDEKDSDYCLLILNQDGSIETQHRYGGSDSDHAEDVLYMEDHCCLAVGTTASFGGGKKDFWFLRTLPNLECPPLTKACGFVENAATGETVSTAALTSSLPGNSLEKFYDTTWTITDTQCTVKSQAP